MPTPALTQEQAQIVGSQGNIKVNAVAGSGKTYTLIAYAQANARAEQGRMLYLAFNKSVQLEAQRRFMEAGLPQVDVRTAHALAFEAVVRSHGYKVRSQGAYKSYELVELLRLRALGKRAGSQFLLANHINRLTAYFCNSTARKVEELDYPAIVHDPEAQVFAKNFNGQIVDGARQLLARMYRREIEITHDFYLKLYQLSQPTLPYSIILFDEGQDASPVMLDVFLRQPARQVIVGDTHQQIYGWRHAVNALETVDATEYALTQSFRFGTDIAALARHYLGWKRHLSPFTPPAITGLGQHQERFTHATLARTNLALLKRAIELVAGSRTVHSVYFEGHLNSYTYASEGASIWDVLHLWNQNHQRIRDKLIRSMRSFEDLEEYAKNAEDAELTMLIEIVKEYRNELPGLIQLLKNRHVEQQDRPKADMIFSTVHKSKGMEYDVVHLLDDFLTEEDLKHTIQEGEYDAASLNEEINLLYVATTRSKHELWLPEKLDAGVNSPYINIEAPKKPQKEEGADGDSLKIAPKRSTEMPWQEKKPKARPWNAEEDAQLLGLYEQGLSLEEIAMALNRPKNNVRNRLRGLQQRGY